MSCRLQVLISTELDAQINKAAQRTRMSKGEWVRRAILAFLRPPRKVRTQSDPLEELRTVHGPTADIEQMLAEIGQGRS